MDAEGGKKEEVVTDENLLCLQLGLMRDAEDVGWITLAYFPFDSVAAGGVEDIDLCNKCLKKWEGGGAAHEPFMRDRNASGSKFSGPSTPKRCVDVTRWGGGGVMGGDDGGVEG